MSLADRYFCSHLARLAVDGATREPAAVNVEEIDAFGVVAAAEEAWPAEIEARLEDGEFAARVYVRRCVRREDGFALDLGFLDGYRWSLADWRPDHLYLAESAPKSKAAGA